MASPRRRPVDPRTQRLILDSGAVLALARNDPRARAVLATARDAGAVISVPAVVVAETVRGTPRDAAVNRVVKAVGKVDPVEESHGRLAGAMLRAAHSTSTIGALVVSVGVGRPCVVLTGDPDDLRPLAADHPEIVIYAI